MKAITLLITLSISFCFISCEKKENTEIDFVSSFKALKNEASWVSTSSWANFSKTEEKFFISGAKRDSEYYQEEVLYFNFYLSDISKSNVVERFYAEWYYIVGGDVISDSYLIDSTADNLIQITSIDTIGKHISGNFIINLIRDKRRSDKGELIQYKNGQFDLNYKEIE
jgi:hypothetical protein